VAASGVEARTCQLPRVGRGRMRAFVQRMDPWCPREGEPCHSSVRVPSRQTSNVREMGHLSLSLAAVDETVVAMDEEIVEAIDPVEADEMGAMDAMEDEVAIVGMIVGEVATKVPTPTCPSWTVPSLLWLSHRIAGFRVAA
jgi:hypothetical protein